MIAFVDKWGSNNLCMESAVFETVVRNVILLPEQSIYQILLVKNGKT